MKFPLGLLLLTLVGLVVSGIQPADRLTWLLEVAPILIGLPILLATYKTFRLTDLLYALLCIHAAILMLGAHYTYAQVPLGFWMEEVFGFTRNHYDRIGHIAQGFVPAILAREILIRRSPLAAYTKWLFFIVVCICLAFSAFYEMLEWWAALLNEQASQAFLGTQGDVWDTQWDMFLALLGAIASQLMLSRVHDAQLTNLLNAK